MSPTANSDLNTTKSAIPAAQSLELDALTSLSSLTPAPALAVSPLATLIQNLGSRDYSEESQAERGLNADPVGKLFVALSSKKQNERSTAKHAVHELAEANPDEILPHLVAGLSSKSGNVATCSMHILGWLGSKGAPAIPALMEKLYTSTNTETQTVLAQMVMSSGEPGRLALMSELFNPESQVREFALAQLADSNSGMGADRLIALLTESDIVVKSFANMQIGKLASREPDAVQTALPILKKLALEPLPRGTSIEDDLEFDSSFFKHNRVKSTALTALSYIDPLAGLEVLAASGKNGAHFPEVDDTMAAVFRIVNLETIPYSIKANLLVDLASGYDQRDYTVAGAPLEGDFFMRYVKPLSERGMYRMFEASPSTKSEFLQEIDKHLTSPEASIRELALYCGGNYLKTDQGMHRLIDMMSDPVLEIQRSVISLLVSNFYETNEMVKLTLDTQAENSPTLGKFIKGEIKRQKQN